MDEARALLIATCASLAKLQMRLIAKSYDRRRTGPNTYAVTDPHWRIEELVPPSPWLDACMPRIGITSVISAIALVQVHLLGMVEAEGQIDGRQACVVLHHLSIHGSTWSTPIQRLAGRLGVDLPGEPRELTYMASLQQTPLPGR